MRQCYTSPCFFAAPSWSIQRLILGIILKLAQAIPRDSLSKSLGGCSLCQCHRGKTHEKSNINGAYNLTRQCIYVPCMVYAVLLAFNNNEPLYTMDVYGPLWKDRWPSPNMVYTVINMAHGTCMHIWPWTKMGIPGQPAPDSIFSPAIFTGVQ